LVAFFLVAFFFVAFFFVAFFFVAFFLVAFFFVAFLLVAFLLAGLMFNSPCWLTEDRDSFGNNLILALKLGAALLENFSTAEVCENFFHFRIAHGWPASSFLCDATKAYCSLAFGFPAFFTHTKCIYVNYGLLFPDP
ncbi:hypothetical protein KKG05_10160, partial [bacterium]|nr:hypothetical protein [bacterium]